MTTTAPRLAPPRRAPGFTLIEMMVVVAVAAILAAIAYPSYLKQVSKSRRSDAKSALLDLAAREETYFSTNNVYTNTASNLGYSSAFPLQVSSGSAAYYQINVTAASSTAFSLSATPIGNQAGDACGTYTLNQLGAQSNTGNTLVSSSCW
ncbi:MAG: prepilin-type N-terminal cleavage/methylation domain-containing protein [Burkholderiales bacterium]|nr:prepilin-type N-terminal cleavage/methylation domain-containing protein [Burkholderiales bacterium]MDE2452653.1 prepilin-type N-terminal cleavage/methylation domain-containing protein [Burkholderiales bacterium]